MRICCSLATPGKKAATTVLPDEASDDGGMTALPKGSRAEGKGAAKGKGGAKGKGKGKGKAKGMTELPDSEEEADISDEGEQHTLFYTTCIMHV